MPNFLFHLTKDSVIVESYGVELPDAESAKREGAKFVGALLQEDTTSVWNEAVSVSITDERGMLVAMLDVIGTISPAYRGRDTQRH